MKPTTFLTKCLLLLVLPLSAAGQTNPPPLPTTPPPLPPPSLLATNVVLGQPVPMPVIVTFKTEATTIPGFHYFLQVSPDLTNWTTVQTFPANGVDAFYTNTTGAPFQYYRAGWSF